MLWHSLGEPLWWAAARSWGDLGYIDLEEKTFATLGQSLRPKSVTYVLGTICYLCLRTGQRKELAP